MPWEDQVEELDRCYVDPVYFIFNYIFTYDGETSTTRPFAAGYPEEYKRKLKKLITDIVAVIREGRDNFPSPNFHLLKSRQTYISFTISAIMTWGVLFHKNFSALITSDKQPKLDNANHSDTNTAMGKIGFMIDQLPDFMRPDQKDFIRSENNLVFIPQQSSIKADSGLNPGRGLQLSMHFGDEFAGQEFANVKLSALREAIKGPNVLASTPKGKANPFYDIWLRGHDSAAATSFRFEQYHWKEKIESTKWDAYWSAAVKRYDNAAELEQELNLSFDGIVATGRVFTAFVQSKHCISMDPRPLGITCDGWDFGFGAPNVNILGTLVNDEIHILDCLFESGTSPKEFAVKVRAMDGHWGIIDPDKVGHVADPSGVSKPREGSNMSSFDLFAQEGYGGMIGANNRILEGIQTINDKFHKDKLFINSKCSELIDALNQAQFPTDRNGNVSKEEYEIGHPYHDLLDALRYLVVYMSANMIHQDNSSSDYLGMGNLSHAGNPSANIITKPVYNIPY